MRRPKALMNYKNHMEQLANGPLSSVLEKKEWFTLRNTADAMAEIFIYEEIGYWGITSDDFVKALNDISAKTIKLRINSPGGSVWDAIAIHSALMAHSADIDVQIDSLAASAASVIAMAGDTITMMPGSQMMIHDALGVGIGNEAELKEYAAWLGEQSNNISTMYARRAPGLTAEEWRDKMLAETWLFAEEAVEMGLADGVYVKPKSAPEPEPEEDPEEPEEESSEEEEPEEEPTPEDRITARHSLKNRGYKYPGRKAAPTPEPSNGFIDLLKNWR